MPESKITAVASKAPAFSLPSSDGTTISVADFSGKTLVVYFYPKADTPGCTKEACGFRDAAADFALVRAAVLGVSPDKPDAVARFARKYRLNFPLLADADHAVCDRYGVWQPKSMMGHKYMGVVRTTFIIDKSGKIAHVFEKVKPKGHEQEVLKWISTNLA